jgi:hypothetical protein
LLQHLRQTLFDFNKDRLLNRPVIAQILAESAAQLETAFATATHMDVDKSLRQFCRTFLKNFLSLSLSKNLNTASLRIGIKIKDLYILLTVECS